MVCATHDTSARRVLCAQLKSDFNGALDKWKRWTIHDEISEGCGARDAEWEYDML